jgi:hypothetical protein
LAAWSSTAQAETSVEHLPSSHVLPISPPITTEDQITLEWTGTTEPGTKLLAFEIWYRFEGGTWKFWEPAFKGDPPPTSADFSFSLDADGLDGLYEFQSTTYNDVRAFEPRLDIPQAWVIVDRLPPFFLPKQLLPIISVE